MKFKVTTQANLLKIQVRLSGSEPLNQQELAYFAQRNLRGFLRPAADKKHSVEYMGQYTIPLTAYLMRPITSTEFFLMIEQIVDVTLRLQEAGLIVEHVLWDLNQVYINERSKELQLIYLPIGQRPDAKAILVLFVNIMNQVRPLGQNAEFLQQFYQFLCTQPSYIPAAIEAYIEGIDPEIVSFFKGAGTAAPQAAPQNPYQQPQAVPQAAPQQNPYQPQNPYQQAAPQPQNPYQQAAPIRLSRFRRIPTSRLLSLRIPISRSLRRSRYLFLCRSPLLSLLISRSLHTSPSLSL